MKDTNVIPGSHLTELPMMQLASFQDMRHGQLHGGKSFTLEKR